MHVPEQPLTVTRQRAAIRQVEAAIAALERGDFDIAITLAAAAEGMFDFRKDGTLFDYMLNHERALAEFSRKDWISILNMERDWLKHSSDQTHERTIDIDSATHMIARACSKLTNWTTPRLDEFRVWCLGRLD